MKPIIAKSSVLQNFLVNYHLSRGLGVHDGLGARIANNGHIDFLWASSLEISASLGLPDASLITMTEVLGAAAVINKASTLPLLVDCDTGFGGQNNVRRLVLECEQIGIAGICIEDKTYPKVNSFHNAEHILEPADIFADKIAAAVKVRSDPQFVIVARTESLIAGQSIEEAVRRAELYHEAGADGLFVHSRADTTREIAAFMSQLKVKIPIIVSPTTYWSTTEAELQKLGVSVVIYSNVGVRLAAKAISEGLLTLANTKSLADIEPLMMSLSDLSNLQEYQKWNL